MDHGMDAHCIYLNVGFTDRIVNLALRIAAIVTLPIRDDQQDALRIMSLLDLTQSGIYRIQKRSAAVRFGAPHLIKNGFRAVGKTAHRSRLRIEGKKKELVFRIGYFQELFDRNAGHRQLGFHTAAGVEYQSNGDGNIGTRKCAHLLLDAVFKDAKSSAREALDAA